MLQLRRKFFVGSMLPWVQIRDSKSHIRQISGQLPNLSTQIKKLGQCWTKHKYSCTKLCIVLLSLSGYYQAPKQSYLTFPNPCCSGKSWHEMFLVPSIKRITEFKRNDSLRLFLVACRIRHLLEKIPGRKSFALKLTWVDELHCAWLRETNKTASWIPLITVAHTWRFVGVRPPTYASASYNHGRK